MKLQLNPLDRAIVGIALLGVLVFFLPALFLIQTHSLWMYEFLVHVSPWWQMVWISCAVFSIPLSVVALMRRDRVGFFGLSMSLLIFLGALALQFLLSPVG